MKLYSVLRVLSIISYLFIFLQGMMIALPLGCLLLFGLFDAGPIGRIFLVLADLALVSLFVISFRQRTKMTVFIEFVAYPLLLLPLIRVLLSFPLSMLN